MSANRRPGPPSSRHRVRARTAGPEASAVRRLAARRSAAPVLGADSDPEVFPEMASAREASEPASQTRLPWGLLTFISLTVVTLVFGGLAAVFGTQASAVASQPSVRNQALSDPGATGQVTSQVTSAIQRLFSYDYANPKPTRNAASQLLTGPAVKQYTAMFAAVKQAAVKNKLVVTTTVSNAGVETLDGDTARVLVFATESDGSADASDPTAAEAMLAVNVVRVGPSWKIQGLDTFSR